MADSDYNNWRRRLSGDFLPIDPSIPECGCWRIRRGDLNGWDAVQIWSDVSLVTGEVIFYASRSGINCSVRSVWPKCAERPVSSTAFKVHKETGKWPDEVASDDMPEGDNIKEAPEHVKFLLGITALEAEAIGWFELEGSKITKQEQADRAANYKEQFLRWEQRADEKRKVALKPILAQERTIRRQWNPVEAKARDAKAAIAANWLRPYLIELDAERKIALLQEGRDPQTIIAGAKAGTGARSASIRMNWRAEVRDYRHFLEWLLSFEELSPYLLSAMDKIANEMANRRVENIPGVAMVEEPVVI